MICMVWTFIQATCTEFLPGISTGILMAVFKIPAFHVVKRRQQMVAVHCRITGLAYLFTPFVIQRQFNGYQIVTIRVDHHSGRNGVRVRGVNILNDDTGVVGHRVGQRTERVDGIT